MEKKKTLNELKIQSNTNRELREIILLSLLIFGLILFSISLAIAMNGRETPFLVYLLSVVMIGIWFVDKTDYVDLRTQAEKQYEKTSREYNELIEKIDMLRGIYIVDEEGNPIFNNLHTHLILCVDREYEYGICDKYYEIDDNFFEKVRLYKDIDKDYNPFVASKVTVARMTAIREALVEEAKNYYKRMFQQQAEINAAEIEKAFCSFKEC